MLYIESGDWDAVADLMSSSAEKVAGAGADFVICPDNTIHAAFDRAVEKSPIPWLHIAQVVAAEAKRKKYKCLGLLGTRWLMEGPVYPAKLEASELAHMIPEPEDRVRINEIIFAELVEGRFMDESRHYFAEVIERLKKRGCDAVVLGCTEIPLLVTPENSPLPTLDTTRLLAKAALKKAIEEKF
jgi:aspartate racemase